MDNPILGTIVFTCTNKIAITLYLLLHDGHFSLIHTCALTSLLSPGFYPIFKKDTIQSYFPKTSRVKYPILNTIIRTFQRFCQNIRLPFDKFFYKTLSK